MVYLPRIVDNLLINALQSVPIVMVDGAHGTGKTTTGRQFCVAEYRFPTDLPLVMSDPEHLLGNSNSPALIEEWQLAGVDLLWAMKDIVDRDPRPGRFLLTGSVQPESYGPTFPLTGRSMRIIMRPMTQRELNGDGHAPQWLQRLLDRELFAPGKSHETTPRDIVYSTGFPGGALGPNTQAWLRAYGAAVTERSTEERKDPTRAARLLQVLAELESQVTPDETVWKPPISIA